MAYEKQTWVTGEVITKEKLNHMEDGIANGGSGVFIANLNTETQSLDKTWNEINTAFTNKQPCYVTLVGDEAVGQSMFPLLVCSLNGDTSYMVAFLFAGDATPTAMACSTTDPDGYPILEQNSGN